MLSFSAYAQPIIIEGAVPNENTKQEILSKLYANYGQENVVDRIQIRQVTAPAGWSNTVSNVINEDLKQVKQGKLTVKGLDIQLIGNLSKPDEIQKITEKFKRVKKWAKSHVAAADCGPRKRRGTSTEREYSGKRRPSNSFNDDSLPPDTLASL